MALASVFYDSRRERRRRLRAVEKRVSSPLQVCDVVRVVAALVAVTLLHEIAERTLHGWFGRIWCDAENLVGVPIRLGLDGDHVQILPGLSSPDGRRAVSNSESAVVTPHRSARRFRRAYNAIARAFSNCVAHRSQAIAGDRIALVGGPVLAPEARHNADVEPDDASAAPCSGSRAHGNVPHDMYAI
ncbi:hypothetical protein HPS36_09805 [Halorubrum salinarum]|uniref:Uncharacterized protein n=1 Tax=Halorubrum salinarum TaxID=2739057 RepID=A0A7D4D022_9EURY|nr:hypothetical protein [Halorubrum salinarum]QKG93143.1 hypothetical protein HPS36_09805 [Halorubrum salinarum]